MNSSYGALNNMQNMTEEDIIHKMVVNMIDVIAFDHNMGKSGHERDMLYEKRVKAIKKPLILKSKHVLNKCFKGFYKN